MPKRARTPTCIAYHDDGTLCRQPATTLDHQRGSMVCWRHDAARTDRFTWKPGDLIRLPWEEAEEGVL
jgi:hypothetical protein